MPGTTRRSRHWSQGWPSKWNPYKRFLMKLRKPTREPRKSSRRSWSTRATWTKWRKADSSTSCGSKNSRRRNDGKNYYLIRLSRHRNPASTGKGATAIAWSNDYPHQNSTWPNSREVINRDMGHLPAADREKLLNANVRKLYSLKVPASLPIAARSE